MQFTTTSQKKSIAALQAIILMCVFFICYKANALATDSISGIPVKPVLRSTNLCVNTELSIEAISPKVERIDWKYNRQTVHTSFTPALVKTVAGIGEGTAADEFRFPSGITVDRSGNIYIADQFNHRVQQWVPGAVAGKTVAGIGGQGDAANQLNYPMAVAVDAAGNLYVSDAANSRIQMFTPGSYIGVTVAGGNGRGYGANQLNMPFGICLDQHGNLYVADNYNHRVQKWAPGAIEGITVAGGNGKGNAANQLQYPSSIKVDKSGTLFIADAANDRVQAWKPGARTGITVAGGNGRGKGMAQLYFPTDIGLNEAGDIFVSDQTNQRIQCWKSGAKTGITVAGGNGQGNDMNQFNYPYGLAVDEDENIYVADQYNHRIQFFQNPDAKINYQFQFKATRPGSYEADIVYRNGVVEKSAVLEVHDLPVITPIHTDENVCTGKQYQLLTDEKDVKWKSSNTAIAEISADGILVGKQNGVVVISYEMQDMFGCINSTSKTITIKETPAVPAIMLAPELIQQSGNTLFKSQQLCAGTSVPLNRMLTSGIWGSSDTNIAKVENGTLKGVSAGNVAISFLVEKNGCTAESRTEFVVLPATNRPVIQGYNKIISGQVQQFNAGTETGIWSSLVEDIATIDQRGFVKGIRPGSSIISFETTDHQGCRVKAEIPVTVQPESPLVQDASYENRQQPAYIRFDQQVTAKAGVKLAFFENASPNTLPVEPIVKNQPGTYRFWVAAIENGIASQRVAFSVTITEAVTTQQLEPVVMGNPAIQFFTIQLKSRKTNMPITIRIADMQGRVIELRQSVQANSTIQFGQNYPSGQYIAEIVQGVERKVVRLIKMGDDNRAVSFTSTIQYIK